MADATAEPEVPEDATAKDATTGHATTGDEPADEAESPDDELKRRFREALERKRSAQAAAAGAGGGRNGPKIRGTHGPVSGKRSFRRKSG
jgi:hypothetical protein